MSTCKLEFLLPRYLVVSVFHYLQPLHREVKGILLYQGFPRPILPTKHPERNDRNIFKQNGSREPVVKKKFWFFTILSSLEMKRQIFFHENFTEIILPNRPKGR